MESTDYKMNGLSLMNGLAGLNGHVKNGYHAQLAHKRNTYEDAEETCKYLQDRTDHRPEIAIVCGSGLGELAEDVENTDIFEYKDVPHFPVSTVRGHKGRLIFGTLAGKCVLCMQGRTHHYEGYSPNKIVFPIQVMKLLGIKTLIVTNAAGGLNQDYNVGDVMVIKDHINLPGLVGQNPLMGPNDERFGPRFPAMSQAYDKELRLLVKRVAKQLDMDFLKEGVYVVQTGPCFETVAECRMLRLLGADVTGMSTVPEVTVATHCGIKTLGMSLVTNKCVMDIDSKEMANHEEVLETGRMRGNDLCKLVKQLLTEIDTLEA